MKWLDFGRHRPASSRLLYGGLGLFAALFLFFYPKTFAIVDEDAYVTQALLFRTGRLTYENSGIVPPHQSVEQAGRIASKYPPGNSLFLLPFTLLGWRAAFLSGLLLALFGALLFRSVLRRLDPEADPTWALLWLFYPAVVLFSRTLMSDLVAATAVLGSFLLLLRRNALLSGLVLGFACLVRYSIAVAVPAWLLLILAGPQPRWRQAFGLVAGLLPFAAAALGWNWCVFGAPLGFPMYLTGFFSPLFFPLDAGYYAVNLLLLYPLMLVLPFFAGRGRRLRLALPGFALLLPYCFFSFVYEGGIAERLTLGMRYLLPALPFFILGFALVADRLVRQFRGMAALKYSGIALLVLASVALSYRHDRYLAVQEQYRDLLYRHLPPNALLVANSDASELVSAAWGQRRWQHFAEFDVPLPTDSAGSVYAAMLAKPGDDRVAEQAAFNALLSRYPGRELVSETRVPYRFRLYRLK